jgi:hypothetical protein
VFLNLSSGNSSGLRDNSGVQLDCELLILLLKGGSIVAIVSVLERNRLDSQSLYIEGKPHGSTSEVPGFGQGDTWSPAEGISGRVRWEPEYRRRYSEYASS